MDAVAAWARYLVTMPVDESKMRDDEEDEDNYDRPRGRRSSDEPKKGASATLWIVVAIGATLLLPIMCCGGLFAFGMFRGAREEAERREAENKASTPYTKMTADELIDDWQPNPVIAAEKYSKQGVEFTGTLHRMDAVGNEIWVFVRGPRGNINREIRVVVKNQRAKEDAKKVTVGAQITVKGFSDGKASADPQFLADSLSP